MISKIHDLEIETKGVHVADNNFKHNLFKQIGALGYAIGTGVELYHDVTDFDLSVFNK